jgi:hypothetical protein
MWQAGNRQRHFGFGSGSTPPSDERRVHTSVQLTHLTQADGEWLAGILPTLQRTARTRPGAVRVEDVVLRYRPGRMGIADAMDATAALFAPLAFAGAEIDRRNEWYIADDDDDDDDDNEDLFNTKRLKLGDAPEQNLLVSARVAIDAAAEDVGAAAIYWAVLALAG